MLKITVEQIDLATKTLKDLRNAVAAHSGVVSKHAENNKSYLAAKAKAKEAMEKDNFDDLNNYNQAMKRHHKMMADLEDKQIDLEVTVERLTSEIAGWPVIPLSEPRAQETTPPVKGAVENTHSLKEEQKQPLKNAA